MDMFCFQCQETVKNQGCTKKGVCGKTSDVAHMQDLLLYTIKGISFLSVKAKENGIETIKSDNFIIDALFLTITNVNFYTDRIKDIIKEGLELRDDLNKQLTAKGVSLEGLHDSAIWNDDKSNWDSKAMNIGVLSTDNEDVRSLRELLMYGLKGIAAYAHHARVLGSEDTTIHAFVQKALASTLSDLSVDEMIAMVLEAGKTGVTTMALLDGANTGTYGNPEITEVNIGVQSKPGILISGHDLKDLEQLLEQTKGSGVDIYTHSEMLPAHYYPAFKKYDNLVGNYGAAWHDQKSSFETFNGPILMTTNCLVPPKDSYKDRLYTTSVVGFEGIKHIAQSDNGKKDFSAIIEQAKQCAAPKEIETGKIVGGFAHNQVLALADKIVSAVKSGAIKKFIVMAGCDGRHTSREYFTDVAKQLPSDTVILTAGCAKYRYNKLELGDIGGIPRVLDAGQCNDCYSLAVIALKLKEVFELDDINDLPLEFDIAWYEQKAVIVLLALLHLGFKGIRLGPTLPAFLSPTVAKVLVDNFDIKGITDPASDVKSMTS